MNNNVWKFSTSPQVIFGRGAIEQIGSVAKREALKRPVILTDKNLVRTGIVKTIQSLLAREKIDSFVFDESHAEPSVEIAEAAGNFAKHHQADGVIGLGGGSNLDVAKFASILLKFGGKPSDYYGLDTFPGPLFPLIAIPTTAGTGSEVTHAAVLTDRTLGSKVSAVSQWLRPTVAIIDPNLADSCPSKVAALAGIDALAHAIEAYTARGFQFTEEKDSQKRPYEGANPMGTLLAEEALRLIGRNLIPAVQDPSDHEARDAMAWAASLAGMAFSNSGVALVHALEFPIGATLHIAHGEGIAILLPHVMRIFAESRIELLARVAPSFGVAIGDEKNMAWSLIDCIERTIQSLGLATRLRDAGAQESDIETFAQKAFQIKRLLNLNPTPIEYKDLLELLQRAY